MRRANDLLSTSVSSECMWRRDLKRQKKSRRLQTSTSSNVPQSQFIEMEPAYLAASVRRAEKEVLPMIKGMQRSPVVAEFRLVQRTKAQVTGDLKFISEMAMLFANTVLACCQAGISMLGPTYPYRCEETLQELQEGPKAKRNDDASFQPFTPANGETPRGFGAVTGGIVNHPETNWWQRGLRAEGPCPFLAASRDPVKAQSNLRAISYASRRGATDAQIVALYSQVHLQADGEPKPLLYEMMLYLRCRSQIPENKLCRV